MLPHQISLLLTFVGNGAMKVTYDIFLSNILCLSKFPFNMLSLSQIAHVYNCCVFFLFFFPNYYIFQDILMKKIFGKGYKFGGLHMLDKNYF